MLDFSHFLLRDLLFSGQSKKNARPTPSRALDVCLVIKTNFTLVERVCIWNAIFSEVGEK
jgi:hypothetical protein